MCLFSISEQCLGESQNSKRDGIHLLQITVYTIANDESEFATDDRLDASLFASTTTTLARHNRHKRYKQQSTDNQTEAYRMCSGNQLWWKGEWAEMAEGIHF